MVRGGGGEAACATVVQLLVRAGAGKAMWLQRGCWMVDGINRKAGRRLEGQCVLASFMSLLAGYIAVHYRFAP